METHIHGRPTIGVLAGWQIYEANINTFLNLRLQGIHFSAQKHGCNLLLACRLRHEIGEVHLRPAWPVFSPESDFIPVGSWNTDGLIVINPPKTAERSHYIQKIIAGGHPVVFIGTGEKGNAVVPDNELGIHLAIQLIEAGRTALSLMLDPINGRLSGDQDIRLPMHLIVRESCGCWPSNLPIEIPLYLQESNKTSANTRDVIVKRVVGVVQKEIQFWNQQKLKKCTPVWLAMQIDTPDVIPQGDKFKTRRSHHD